MPETTNNGYSNGSHHNGYELEDMSTFLFTSESVGEGHPGKNSLSFNYFQVPDKEEIFLKLLKETQLLI